MNVPCVQKQLQHHYREFKAIHVGNFREELNSELICKAIVDLNHDEALEHLNSSLVKVINKGAPMIIKKGIKKRKDFTTTEISTLQRERRKAERKHRKSKSEDDCKLFKDLVSSVSKAVKTSRNVFYTNKLSRCKDGKETFQVVNKLLDKCTMKGILPAHLHEDKLCNEFEKYFHEKIEKIRISIEEKSSTHQRVMLTLLMNIYILEMNSENFRY